MPKVKSKDSFSHKLLKAIAMGGAVVIASTNPYFGIRALGAFQRELKRKQWKEFQKAVYNLKRTKRLNVTQNQDGTYTLEITQIGKNTVEKYDLATLKISKPDEWDGGWRVISFDIPKNKKAARQVLLSKLKELGFIMLQKSIWVHPFECRKELAVVAKAFEVEPYVYCFIAWEFSGEKEYRLKKLFETKNNLVLK
ncbi:MAG: hypothetical protein Q8R55_04675 [Candidatus Taylorbacteria bacterium]|nr:hypothetical protein [Candidatus Taylorbacteria bacterium]